MTDGPQVTLIIHRNTLGDLPDRLAAYANSLQSQPKAQADIKACVEVLKTALKQDGHKIRVSRPYGRWEWLQQVCTHAKAYTAATIIELKLGLWVKARDDKDDAAALKEAADDLRAREEAE